MEAAATVFQREGYGAATIADIIATAGVTKGALYFHFQSKEDLAQGILGEQSRQDPAPQDGSQLQQLVDTGLLFAHRLKTDSLVRASVRLSLDQHAAGLDRRGPFQAWREHALELLVAAKVEGELLPHVMPVDTAELYVGCFAGLQMMSQTMSDYEDLPERLSALQRHILPSITVPAVLAGIDSSPGRTARILAALGARPLQVDAVGAPAGAPTDAPTRA
jgi:AcrR family transcriptional regulator